MEILSIAAFAQPGALTGLGDSIGAIGPEFQALARSSRKYEIRFLIVEGVGVVTIQHVGLCKRNDDRVVQLQIAEFFTLRGGRIHEHRVFSIHSI